MAMQRMAQRVLANRRISRTSTFCALIVFLSCLGLGESAFAAEVFKCTVDGHVQYQATPCEGAVPSERIQTGARSSLVGCYTTPMTGLKEGFAIRLGTSSPYELFFKEGKNSQGIPLKTATRQEMQRISAAFGIEVTEGLSMIFPPDTPNQKPVGLFKGRDAAGKDLVLAYFFFDAGIATKTTCR
jgi:hypothetical protein